MATADVNGDGVPDVIVGTGPGSPPRVKIFDGAKLLDESLTDDERVVQIHKFFPYEMAFTGGVSVAAEGPRR